MLVSGSTAQVEFMAEGGNATGYTQDATSWSLTLESGAGDITPIGSEFACTQSGLLRWSGSYNTIIDDSLLAIDLGATVATARFYFTPDAYIEGPVHVNSIEPSLEVSDAPGSMTVSFTGNGLYAFVS